MLIKVSTRILNFEEGDVYEKKDTGYDDRNIPKHFFGFDSDLSGSFYS